LGWLLVLGLACTWVGFTVPARYLLYLCVFALMGVPTWIEPYLGELPGGIIITWQEVLWSTLILSYGFHLIRGQLSLPRPAGVVLAFIVLVGDLLFGTVYGLRNGQVFSDIVLVVRPVIFYAFIFVVASLVSRVGSVKLVRDILLLAFVGGLVGTLASLAFWVPSESQGRFYTPLYSVSALLIPIAIQFGFVTHVDRRLSISSRMVLPVLIMNLVLSIHRSSWLITALAVPLLLVINGWWHPAASRRLFARFSSLIGNTLALAGAAVLLISVVLWLQSTLGLREWDVFVSTLVLRSEETLAIQEVPSIVTRVDQNLVAWRAFSERPLLGGGLGLRLYFSESGKYAVKSDNMWLMLAAQLGLPGVFALAGFCLSPLVSALRARRLLEPAEDEESGGDVLLRSILVLIPVTVFMWAAMMASSQNPFEKLPYIVIVAVFWGTVEGIRQHLALCQVTASGSDT
jgi:uncharacterized protein YjeT (DUF2065 family)